MSNLPGDDSANPTEIDTLPSTGSSVACPNVSSLEAAWLKKNKLPAFISYTASPPEFKLSHKKWTDAFVFVDFVQAFPDRKTNPDKSLLKKLTKWLANQRGYQKMKNPSHSGTAAVQHTPSPLPTPLKTTAKSLFAQRNKENVTTELHRVVNQKGLGKHGFVSQYQLVLTDLFTKQPADTKAALAVEANEINHTPLPAPSEEDLIKNRGDLCSSVLLGLKSLIGSEIGQASHAALFCIGAYRDGAQLRTFRTTATTDMVQHDFGNFHQEFQHAVTIPWRDFANSILPYDDKVQPPSDNDDFIFELSSDGEVQLPADWTDTHGDSRHFNRLLQAFMEAQIIDVLGAHTESWDSLWATIDANRPLHFINSGLIGFNSVIPSKMRSSEALGLLEMLFEYQSGDLNQVAFKFSIDAYKAQNAPTSLGDMIVDGSQAKESEVLENNCETPQPNKGPTINIRGALIAADVPEAHHDEQNIINEDTPIPLTGSGTVDPIEISPSHLQTENLQASTPGTTQCQKRKSTPHIDEVLVAEESPAKKRRINPKTVDLVAEPRRSTRRKGTGKDYDISYLPAVLQSWKGKHAVQCSDGKKRDWAREFEPWMRSEVIAGNTTKVEYLQALEDAELSEYFPAAIDWA
ncbi:hypothetical protein DL96DRAFT_1716512 [Flagelloscypha sp. PMI_526]|nr:hypothetical protein DL96DRAFT_1716512 [Flagelloscypha sp. PMI_526]